jgi:hypothetical protein
MIYDSNHHCDFHKAYARIFESLYILYMFKRLRRYIHHCKLCLKEQTKRHSFYDELSFIKTMILFFHTMIIDFIAIFFAFYKYDALLTSTNKFFKRINLTSEKKDWNASKWVSVWLDILQKEEWRLLTTIISDRDLNFVDAFWKAIFQHLEIVLHFITTYHLSIDDQSKRTNQIVKIVMKYALMKEKDFIKIISSI